MEYAIITEATETSFVELVNKSIDAGWVPCGGVSMSQYQRRTEIGTLVLDICYAQALTRTPEQAKRAALKNEC